MYSYDVFGAMIRKQVYLDPKKERELKRMARETGKTEATIIREALDHLILETRLDKERMEAWNTERAFIDQ
jgi:predicted DNA-binding protein